MSPEAFSEWQGHLSLEASSAATLAGLVFVAASINLARIVTAPGLRGRVIESLLQFLQVFFICLLMTIPRQSFTAMALEVLGVALLSWGVQLMVFLRYRRARLGHPRWWLLLRIAQTHASTIPFLIAAGSLFLRRENALHWLASGFFFSFVTGIMNSLVLLLLVANKDDLLQNSKVVYPPEFGR